MSTFFPTTPPDRVLLIQLRQLGDILLTTPCIKAIKTAVPNAKVSFLAHPMAKPILSGNTYLDEVYYYDPKNGVGDFLRLVAKLRRQRFQLIADFMHNPRSALFAVAATRGNCLRTTMFGRRNFLYHHNYHPPEEYIVREKLGLLTSLGLEGPFDQRPLVPWAAADLGPASQLFEGEAEASGPRVILSATHRRPHRRWPKAHFIELARYLYTAWNADIIWVWGPGEEEFVRDISKDTPVPTRISPNTTLKELAALMANADFFVGNSNGPSHFAVSQDTPSFQLHGHTSLRSWCPLTARHRGIEPSDKSASAEELIRAIPVDAVLAEVEKMREIVLTHQKLRPSMVSAWRS